MTTLRLGFLHPCSYRHYRHCTLGGSKCEVVYTMSSFGARSWRCADSFRNVTHLLQRHFLCYGHWVQTINSNVYWTVKSSRWNETRKIRSRYNKLHIYKPAWFQASAGKYGEVDVNYVILGYYAASSGNFLLAFQSNYRSHLQGSRILAYNPTRVQFSCTNLALNSRCVKNWKQYAKLRQSWLRYRNYAHNRRPVIYITQIPCLYTYAGIKK